MWIKDLEKAESLPKRESMRRSSEYYEDYGCSRRYSRRYYQWMMGFLRKHIGEHIDGVYSKFRKSLSGKHVSREVFDEVMWSFRSETTDSCFSYRHIRFYIDDDGILRRKERKRRNSRDVTLRYGEPEVRYVLNQSVAEAKLVLYVLFGRRKALDMIENGIHPNTYNDKFGGNWKFDEYCWKHRIPAPGNFYYNYNHLTWVDVWRKVETYPMTVVLEYRTREYRRYRAEQLTARKVAWKAMLKEKRERFNLVELKRAEAESGRRPILLKD